MKKIDELKSKIENHIQKLGCPPAGDGMKADGSPDGRCSKGGGSGSGGGSKGGSKGGDKGGSKDSAPARENTTTITNPIEIQNELKNVPPVLPKIDPTPNATMYNGEPLRELSEKEINDNIEWHMRTPVKVWTKSGRSETPDALEFVGRERATQAAIADMTGSWLSPADTKDFLAGNMSTGRGGNNFAIKGSKMVD
jgi:hypothetical protein